MIQDDILKLTDYQKMYARILFPLVIRFTGGVSVKYITHLIVTYLAPEIHAGYVLHHCLLSFDNQWLATSGANLGRTIDIWRMATGTKHATLDHGGHTDFETDVIHTDFGFVTNVIFTSDSQYILTSADREIMLWSVRTGKRLHTFQKHHDKVVKISLTADDRRLLSTSSDMIGIWSVETGTCESTYRFTNNFYLQVPHATLCNNEQSLIIVVMEGIYIFSVSASIFSSTLKLERTIDRPNTALDFLSVDGDQFLLTDRWHHTVEVWDDATKTFLQIFQGHRAFLECGVFAQGNSKVVSHDSTNKLCIWRVTDGACMHQFTHSALQHWQIREPKKMRTYWLEEVNTEGILVYGMNKVHILAINSGEIIFTFPTMIGANFQISWDGHFFLWNSNAEIDNNEVILKFMTFTDHKKNMHN